MDQDLGGTSEVFESRMKIPTTSDGERVTHVEGTLLIPDDAHAPLNLAIALVDAESGEILARRSTAQTRPVRVPAVVGRFLESSSKNIVAACWVEPTTVNEAPTDQPEKDSRKQARERRRAATACQSRSLLTLLLGVWLRRRAFGRGPSPIVTPPVIIRRPIFEGRPNARRRSDSPRTATSRS